MGPGSHGFTRSGGGGGARRAGTDRLASRELHLDQERALAKVAVVSAFPDGGAIPTAYTADGGGFAPPITWDDVPASARSVVLVCEDPDTPTVTPFVHWAVYGVPAGTATIESTPAYGHEGLNSAMRTGYTPPAPPPGDGVHHYHFELFALDTDLQLDNGATRSELLEAMRGHIVAWGETVGTYARG